MKMVLDIAENQNPKNNDILVFDKEDGKWKVSSKNLFLFETNKKIANMEKEIKELRDEVVNQKNQIIEIAKIVKGEIE